MNEPHREKICLRKLRTGPTQTGLYNQRRCVLENTERYYIIFSIESSQVAFYVKHAI